MLRVVFIHHWSINNNYGIHTTCLIIDKNAKKNFRNEIESFRGNNQTVNLLLQEIKKRK